MEVGSPKRRCLLRADGGQGQGGGERWVGVKGREASRGLPGPALGEGWRVAIGRAERRKGSAPSGLDRQVHRQVGMSRGQGAEGLGALESPLSRGQWEGPHKTWVGEEGSGPFPGGALGPLWHGLWHMLGG